jgi:hypothetical protein
MNNIRTMMGSLGRLTLTTVAMALALTTASFAQQKFKTADEAAEALVNAARAGDRKTVLAVLGRGAAEIISSGDPVEDENTRKLFVAAYDAKHSVKMDGDKPATLLVGNDDFPFAIPLVKKDDGWSFDTAAGRQEVLARRIGRNELAAVQVCLAYFDAQNDYANVTPKEDGMSVYAQRIVSRPGRKDGLFWPTAEGEQQSPIGEAVAGASRRGYRVGSGEPFHGYYYRILTRQGPSAPGGALNYVVDGKMVGGFAMIAWPAEYGNSGIATFLVNHQGIVYEKDLGRRTRRAASRITTFNPDHTWKRVVATEQLN